MRKANAARHPFALIADDAVDQIECAHAYAEWFDALAYSIRDALERKTICIEADIYRAKTLAGLAQYLAGDLAGNLDHSASELRQQLGSIEGGGGEK